MIVSRSALKEIRSKQSTIQKRRSLIYQSGSKKVNCKEEGFIKKAKTNNNKSRESEKQNSQPIKDCILFSSCQNIIPNMDLSRSSIRQLKFDLTNQISLSQIRSLNLSHNDIREILPTILVPFQFLQNLNLSNNKLQKISFPYNKMSLKQLAISQNKVANLNLQHLKCLESIDASYNRLIFITLPESIKTIILDHNMLANTYFIEKCSKVQTLSMNFNFIYDLNFNSMSELEKAVKSKNNKKMGRFNFLKRIECSNNKICHLNGFRNLNCLQILRIDNNELPLSRENVNQLLLLQELSELSMLDNSQEGVYSFKEFESILFDRLTHLKNLNSKQKKDTIDFNEQQQANCANEQSDRQNFDLYQSPDNRVSLINQSTIRQNQLSVLGCSGQKPFRLFLDDECSQQHQSASMKKPQQHFQRIYTLGDVEDKEEQTNVDDARIFREMTTQQNSKERGLLQQQYMYHYSIQGISQLQKMNKKLYQLQKQLSNKSSSQSRILLPIIQLKLPSHLQYEITNQTRNFLKMIHEMSLIPPRPIKSSSNTLLISKRLDQDEDEYFLFSKLFQRQNGILYLKKIFLLEEFDVLFVGEDEEMKREYQFGFFNGSNLGEVYKKMKKSDCLLSELIDDKMKSNLVNYLSPIPSAFGCHHIAVRYLTKKASAFDNRNQTPTCYLIESKKL